jgi:DNA-binding transcriptional regulator YhcF (GntR family)
MRSKGASMPSSLVDTSRFTLRGDLPAHRQIAAYLKAVIALGHFCPGDALPGVATLSAQTGASVADVRRAYAELVVRGFAVADGSRRKVSDEHAAVADPSSAEEICERMWELIAEARRAGMTRTELQRLFAQLLARP